MSLPLGIIFKMSLVFLHFSVLVACPGCFEFSYCSWWYGYVHYIKPWNFSVCLIFTLFHWWYLSLYIPFCLCLLFSSCHITKLFCLVLFTVYTVLVLHLCFTKLVGPVVMLLTCILDVVSLNLGHNTGYPDSGFLWFSPAPLGRCRDGTSIRPYRLPSTSFPIHLSFYHSFLYSLWYW
jgi:hypothetical protein